MKNYQQRDDINRQEKNWRQTLSGGTNRNCQMPKSREIN